MLTALVIGAYALLFGSVARGLLLMKRRHIRRMQNLADKFAADMRELDFRFPRLEPYTPEPIPEDDDPDPADEYADTIVSVRGQLTDLADHGYPVAAALKEVDALARQVGV